MGGMNAVTRIHASKQPRRPHYLREWMEARGLRAVDLAEETNIDKSLISRWLAGATPSEENHAKLRAFFGIEDDEGIFRHPDDDWMARFLRGRDRAEVERIKATLEAAFPKRHA